MVVVVHRILRKIIIQEHVNAENKYYVGGYSLII